MKLLVRLLTIPLDSLSTKILPMGNFPQLMSFMKFTNRRTVALRICQAVIKERASLDSAETVDQLLEFVKPLLADDESGKEESYEFDEGQENVARLVHLVSHSTSVGAYFDLVLRLKKVFLKGGIKRMKYTIPALVFNLIRLSNFLSYQEMNVQNY